MKVTARGDARDDVDDWRVRHKLAAPTAGRRDGWRTSEDCTMSDIEQGRVGILIIAGFAATIAGVLIDLINVFVDDVVASERPQPGAPRACT